MTAPFGHGKFTGIENIDSDHALIGLSFEDQFRAQEFLTAMTRLASKGALKLRDAVIVSKDDKGDVRVRETIDPQAGRSAMSGAIWTGFLGLIVGGPVGWLAGMGIGAGAGAITAKVIDLGVPDEWVDWFRIAVREGTTTVVVLAEGLDFGALEQEAHRFAGAELVHATLPGSSIDQLRRALGDTRVDDHRDESTASYVGDGITGTSSGDMPAAFDPPVPPSN